MNKKIIILFVFFMTIIFGFGKNIFLYNLNKESVEFDINKKTVIFNIG